MAGMYPDDEVLNIYGEPVNWPGMDPDTGKFTNGDFDDPLKKPSFIPVESMNLILDNLSELIKVFNGTPNNKDIDQLAKLFIKKRCKVGRILFSIDPDYRPADEYDGVWSLWGQGRVPVGVDPNQAGFNTVEKIGGEQNHTLTIEEMPIHRHSLAVSFGGNLNIYSLGSSSVTGNYVESTAYAGNDLPHNNLQPYITCYMWKRTA